MKKSFYNLGDEYNGNYIIFNTRTRSCVILSETEYWAFENKLSNAVENLYELGLYVEDTFDEVQSVIDTIKNNILHDMERIRSHTIYTTTCCNAHCAYCFEDSYIRESMSEQTALDVARYIIKHQGNAKKLYVIWFGGEPMLNPKAMDVISEEIKNKISDDVEFRTSMYTNGLLFTKENIEYAKTKWNLKSVQITLDGMEETYEKVKQFGTTNSFEQVICNIKDLLNAGLRVQVRLNYDEFTFQEILNLIEFLSREFQNYEKIYVYGYKIFQNENIDNSKWMSEDYDFAILEKLIQCGFCDDILATIKGNMNTCLAGSEYSKLYLPNGKIIKCNRAMDRVIGDIYGNLNRNEMDEWKNNRLHKKCYTCKLLPVCGGGCIYEFMNGLNGCMNSETIIKQKLQYYMKNIVEKETSCRI